MALAYPLLPSEERIRKNLQCWVGGVNYIYIYIYIYICNSEVSLKLCAISLSEKKCDITRLQVMTEFKSQIKSQIMKIYEYNF